jgi:hypothetical protein
MFRFKVQGLDALQRKLTDLQHRADAMSGSHEVPLADLFTSEFMLLHTDFDSLESMFTAGGMSIRSQADFEAIPLDTWDVIVRGRTRFQTWEEMKQAAATEYLRRQLDL